MPRILLVAYDVTDLSQPEVDQLESAASAQGEASHPATGEVWSATVDALSPGESLRRAGAPIEHLHLGARPVDGVSYGAFLRNPRRGTEQQVGVVDGRAARLMLARSTAPDLLVFRPC